MSDERQFPDPTRDLLAQQRLEPQADGSLVRRLIPLAEAARDWRGLLDSDGQRRGELGLEYPDEGEQSVAMTWAHARVLASMLEELSARLVPGRAVGAIQADEDVSEVVSRAAQSLRQLA
jgi:hypothetical protein